jgi:hypothetical protein
MWAAGYARDPHRGGDWEVTGPGITTDKATPGSLPLGNGVGTNITVQAFGNQIFSVSPVADVLVLSVGPNARVSDDSGHDYLLDGGGTFCHLTTGCECPGQTTPPSPLPLALTGSNVLLAMTGGLKGASGKVSGMSLARYCTLNLTGTWTGTWVDRTPDTLSGSFTVTLVQSGNTLTGSIVITGTLCLSGGSVSGSVTGNNISFGVVSSRITIAYTGTASNSLMSGTYGTNYLCADAQGMWSAHRQ